MAAVCQTASLGFIDNKRRAAQDDQSLAESSSNAAQRHGGGSTSLSEKKIRLDLPSSIGSSTQRQLTYHDKVILAPMVRVGECPTRLAALHYGAHLVFTPEIIDKKLIDNDRVEGLGQDKGVVHYIKRAKGSSNDKDELSLSLHRSEKDRLILQLGTASRELAIKAALTVVEHGDVAGVDVNCGCPKHFSISGGMGASLLSDPERLCSILTGLVENVPCSISCKIRMLPDQTETIDLVKRLAATGIRALTVHCRTKDMRSSEPALLHRLKELVDAVRLINPTIALIANGDCWDTQDVPRIKSMTGVDSLMIARGAQKSPACFAEDGQIHDLEQEVIPRFLAYAQFLDNRVGNTKYILSQMYRERTRSDPARKSGRGQALMRCKTIDEMLAVYNVDPGLNASLMKEVEDECSDR